MRHRVDGTAALGTEGERELEPFVHVRRINRLQAAARQLESLRRDCEIQRRGTPADLAAGPAVAY